MQLLRIVAPLAVVVASGCGHPSYPSAVKVGSVEAALRAQDAHQLLAIQHALTTSDAHAPIVTSFDYAPKDAPAGTPLRLVLTAHDPDAHGLQMAWAATSGQLSANSGESVSWLAGGKPEAGPVTVKVMISNGFASTNATLTLNVGADGSVKLQPVVAAPAVPAPMIAVKPDAAPGAALLAAPAIAPALPEKAAPLFAEDFAGGLARWQIDSPPGAPRAGDPAKAWTVVDADGASALSLADRGSLAATQRTFYLKTLQAIDLAKATEPRLRLRVKNADGAETSIKAVWQSADVAHPEETLIGTRFTADATGQAREFELDNLAGRTGRLILMARVDQGAAPLIQEVTVYDGAK
ncbi:MAG: hypothetical protein JWM80_4997 [Cyanobacteria bacterium RYN_339]|nr:hypothetical protein [Cyanobacteria bacterium RYN_339]